MARTEASSCPGPLENYSRLWDPLYAAILWRSVWIAVVSTALCLLLGFPLALFIAKSGKRKNLYLSLVILPFWTSYLIRTYAWMSILRDTGLINVALQALNLIREPLPLLYNDGAVILGLVYAFLPFMVLPLYATLERLDHNLLEAAADLGARPFEALVRVTLAAVRSGNSRRSDPGVHSVPRHLPHVGFAGRQQDRDGRQSGAESIHELRATGRSEPATSLALMAVAMLLLLSRAPSRRGAPMKRGLALYAVAAYAFLHVPLLILAVFSFNASRFTVWEGFSLNWYRALLSDRDLIEASVNSLIIALARPLSRPRSGRSPRTHCGNAPRRGFRARCIFRW